MKRPSKYILSYFIQLSAKMILLAAQRLSDDQITEKLAAQ